MCDTAYTKPRHCAVTAAMRCSVELGATRKTRSSPVCVTGGDPLATLVGDEVGGDDAGAAGGGEVVREGGRAVSQDEVPVGHHQRRGAGVTHRAGGRERVVHPDAALEGLVRGIGDDRAVHERVAVGDADLDDVDTRLDHGNHRLDRALDAGKADGQVADEGGAVLRTAASEHVADTDAGGRGAHSWVLPSPSAPRVVGGAARGRVAVDEAEVLGSRVHVLVAASGEVDQQQGVRAELAADLDGAGEGVGGLERGDDPLGAAEQLERLHGLLVGGVAVLGPAGVAQVGVLGADARVVQTGARWSGTPGLAVVVLHEVAEGAVQDPGRAGREPRRVAAGLDALSPGLDADEPHVGVVDEPVEDPHGVGPAPDAGDDGVGQPSGEVEHLGARLDPDDPVEVADHLGERVRSGDRAEDVVGVADVGHPVAQGVVDGVLEGGAAGGHGDDLGAEHPHAGDVEGLSLGVDLAHVDDAVETHQGRGRGGGDPVLARAGLGDDAGLAHPLGEQRLREDVVDLVRAGVVEVLALEDDPGVTRVRGEPRHLGDDARAPGVGAVQPLQLAHELGVHHRLAARLVELLQRRDQRLGDVAPAEVAEPTRTGQGFGGQSGHEVAPAAMSSYAARRGSLPRDQCLADQDGVGSLGREAGGVRRSTDARLGDLDAAVRDEGASRAKVSGSTARVLRLRALTPTTVAPASTARRVSSSSWTSTRAVIPRSRAMPCMRHEVVLGEGGNDEQDEVGPVGPCLEQLVVLDHEVLAQHRDPHGLAHGVEVVERAVEAAPLGEHAHRGGTTGLVVGGEGCGVGDGRPTPPCSGWTASPRR